MIQILDRQTKLLETLGTKSSMHQTIGNGGTTQPLKIFTENQAARLLGWCGLSWNQQHLIPVIWNDLLAEPTKEAKLAFFQMEFSMEKTKDPDLVFQITEQMVKDFSNLYSGRGMDLNFDTSHYGFTPFSIIPLNAENHRERIHEEQVWAMATNTTVADHKRQKKFVLMLDLMHKALLSFLKC